MFQVGRPGGKDNSDESYRKSRMLWRIASGPALQPFLLRIFSKIPVGNGFSFYFP